MTISRFSLSAAVFPEGIYSLVRNHQRDMSDDMPPSSYFLHTLHGRP
jgi:hypothetical protein